MIQHCTLECECWESEGVPEKTLSVGLLVSSMVALSLSYAAFITCSVTTHILNASRYAVDLSGEYCFYFFCNTQGQIQWRLFTNPEHLFSNDSCHECSISPERKKVTGGRFDRSGGSVHDGRGST